MTLLRELAVSHLKLRLKSIHGVLRAAADAQIASAARLARADLTPLCITEDEALHLLDDAECFACDSAPGTWGLGDAAPDPDAEAQLRALADEADLVLPLDAMTQAFELDAFEQFAVAVCAAPGLDRSYERIYAFILDELNRRAASIELVALLAAAKHDDRIAYRHALARSGRLRRSGILVAHGDPGELRQELRLADGLLDHLTGDGSDLACFCRDTLIAAEIRTAADPRVLRLADAMSCGALRVAGIWGPQRSAKEEFAHGLAAALGLKLRRWTLPAGGAPSDLRRAAEDAVTGDALLWIVADDFAEPAHRATVSALADELARLSVRTVVTAAKPWRPAQLLADSAYAEIELAALDLVSRRAMWSEELPELEPDDAMEMAARLRFSRGEVCAAARMTRTEADIAPDSSEAPIKRLRRAAAALSESRSREFATLIRPKRGPDDLILPPAVHRQVMEIAQYFRAWPIVSETWGFGRLTTGHGGIKALFTGESGTGKTLAAEVIAGALQMPLLRVELSRVVSKWVGETEKNLEAAFAEAEDGQAVLFFDEADALLGKRGDVESGTDRYANLEVSYLLQRLDDHAGLVLLASNLRENIDSAFMRRFQAILHFPRPERAERLRIWHMAFPPEAPVDLSLDFEALASLDMTGAGIVGAARNAALFAAEDGTGEIGKSHVVRAIARQFRREARLLTPVELGPYASLLKEAR